jgi:two-component system, OmpR family, sensor histidine kinase CpxA
MRGLFFKIFVILWIAQSLVFVISTALILRHRYPNPSIQRQSLNSFLHREAREGATVFEHGGCSQLAAYSAASQQTVMLSDANGKPLCGTPIEGADEPLLDRINGRQAGDHYVWSLLTEGPSGKSYVFQISLPYTPEEHTWYQDLWHFAFPQAPVAIAVGGAATFVLVLLFTRPLVRLRTAARELARGNLNTRVREATPRFRLGQGDEFHALVHDFNHMAERLESMVHAQQLLLRDVSHELRSPLARLSVALELAREDAAPEMTGNLERIERETVKLNQLISQLLTLSSMEAIDRASNFAPVSLDQLLKEIIPDAQFEAQQRQCSVALTAAGPCVIQGNRELLYRAIENVVRNAIRYTESGTEVEITLTTSARAAVIEISDHGPGIPENEIQSIFRPFYRVDPARSPGTGGSGVGLAIAERAVRLHHGELQAYNRGGGGTTIRMRFPLDADAQG